MSCLSFVLWLHPLFFFFYWGRLVGCSQAVLRGPRDHLGWFLVNRAWQFRAYPGTSPDPCFGSLILTYASSLAMSYLEKFPKHFLFRNCCQLWLVRERHGRRKRAELVRVMWGWPEWEYSRSWKLGDQTPTSAGTEMSECGVERDTCGKRCP